MKKFKITTKHNHFHIKLCYAWEAICLKNWKYNLSYQKELSKTKHRRAKQSKYSSVKIANKRIECNECNECNENSTKTLITR